MHVLKYEYLTTKTRLAVTLITTASPFESNVLLEILCCGGECVLTDTTTTVSKVSFHWTKRIVRQIYVQSSLHSSRLYSPILRYTSVEWTLDNGQMMMIKVTEWFLSFIIHLKAENISCGRSFGGIIHFFGEESALNIYTCVYVMWGYVVVCAVYIIVKHKSIPHSTTYFDAGVLIWNVTVFETTRRV